MAKRIKLEVGQKVANRQGLCGEVRQVFGAQLWLLHEIPNGKLILTWFNKRGFEPIQVAA